MRSAVEVDGRMPGKEVRKEGVLVVHANAVLADSARGRANEMR